MTITQEHLVKISNFLWELPQTLRGDMRVPARIYASQALLQEILRDRSLEQLVNVATLPGIRQAAIVMPDAHEGYGFPIGGVAAMSYPDGVISPGGIGYDINCGVRLLKSSLNVETVRPYLESLAKQLYQQIPAGVGRGGKLKLGIQELDHILKEGVGAIIKQGYGEGEDTKHIESAGVLSNADPAAVSVEAKNRGRDQLGTMGAGNHFVEIDRIDQVFNQQLAQSFGIFLNQIVILIHTGSRGLGHQIATDYIRVMLKIMPKYQINLPDRELACVPFSSAEGSAYFGAMAAAANFAWSNRQMITWEVRQAWRSVLGKDGGKLSILYDVAHNIAKIEEHQIGNITEKVIVHRKGATRAFGPGHPELVSHYRLTGQPVIIPGSMGTASYVLVGTNIGMQESFGSCCHGAGRRLSRHAAKKEIHGKQLFGNLQKEGIHIQTGSIKGLAEEAPLAYKNIEEIVDVVHNAGIATKVARLRPLVVVKG